MYNQIFLNYCEFQDLNSGKMIGNAEMCLGLYILKVANNSEGQPQKAVGDKYSFSISCSNKDNTIMLYNYHLGHPSFMYLKNYFPHYSIINQNYFNVKSVNYPSILITLFLFNRTNLLNCFL